MLSLVSPESKEKLQTVYIMKGLCITDLFFLCAYYTKTKSSQNLLHANKKIIIFS